MCGSSRQATRGCCLLATQASCGDRAPIGDWIKMQPHSELRTDLERDAEAIRDAVFRPLGGGIFAGGRGWNAFKWPDTLPPFLLMDPDISVKLASGDLVTVTVTKALPDFANVVFADETMQAPLERTMIALGGTKRRQPTGIMETPNQPAGESMNILSLWNTFPARPGHWAGWEFTSYPRLTRIEFLDAARTRAAANMTIGYSGATVVLEKRASAWVPVRLTNEWISASFRIVGTVRAGEDWWKRFCKMHATPCVCCGSIQASRSWRS